MVKKIEAYDSYARLSFANSECIVCQITRDAFIKKRFLALDWLKFQSIIDYNRWLLFNKTVLLNIQFLKLSPTCVKPHCIMEAFSNQLF